MRKVMLFFALLVNISPAFVLAQSVCPEWQLPETCETGMLCTFENEVEPLSDSLAFSDGLAQLSLTDTLTLTAFGTLSLENQNVTPDLAVLEAENAVGYGINVRAGAGTEFEIVGEFPWDGLAQADGRNADGKWIRLQTEELGTVWASTELILLMSGSIDDLAIVEDTPAFAFQAFTLSAGDSACSGVLVEAKAEFALTVNEVNISGEDEAIFWLQASEDDLNISALQGDILIDEESLNAGQILADGEITSVSFADLAGLPVLPEMACLVGGMEVAYAEPDETSEEITLDSDLPYLVTGQTEEIWWRLQAEDQTVWVSEASTWGNCDSVAQIDLSQPALVTQPTGSPVVVIESYLNARVDSNTATLQNLSCNAWQSQARIQADSFRSMDASLEGLACFEDGSDDNYQYVSCSGKIVTVYNGESRDWPLGRYRLVAENGSWKMCGEG